MAIAALSGVGCIAAPETAPDAVVTPLDRPGATPLPSLHEQRVAVARDTTNSVMEGGNERVVARTRNPNAVVAFPRWSSDGHRIGYVESDSLIRLSRDSGDDVFTANPREGIVKVLRPHVRPGEQITGMDWTPDGRALILGLRQVVRRKLASPASTSAP
jgi:hypothetical protein